MNEFNTTKICCTCDKPSCKILQIDSPPVNSVVKGLMETATGKVSSTNLGGCEVEAGLTRMTRERVD